MKKGLIIGMCALLLLSACGTHSMTGAYVGSGIGRVVGSAVGDLSGGRRGFHTGAIIGTLGGLAAGAAIGAAVDKAEQRRVENAIEQRQQRMGGYNDRSYNNDERVFDPTGSGDDRIMIDGGYANDYSLSPGHTVEPTPEIVATFDGYKLRINPAIEIRNARVVDANEDGALVRDEECYVTFDIMNNSDKPIFNIQPTVVDVTGNKHVHISPNLNIENINPHKGVRYTATIKGDHRLKDGEVVIRVAVAHENREIASQIKEFTVPTRKKAQTRN